MIIQEIYRERNKDKAPCPNYLLFTSNISFNM